MILTAGYILWAIQRVYLGAEYKGPHPEALTPITLRELAIAAPLLALAILLRRLPAGAARLHAADGGSAGDRSSTEWTKANRKAEESGDEAITAVEHDMARYRCPLNRLPPFAR